MKKYFLDSNIFLRVLTADNKKMLSECVLLIKRIKSGKIKVVTSNFVLAEIVWTLGSAYNFTKTKIASALKIIMNLSGLDIVDKCDTLVALELYGNYSVKFIDALIASNPDIQSGKMIVVSYDKDFDKLKVKRVEPQNINK